MTQKDRLLQSPECSKAHDADDEHMPWHYVEGGIICACGLGMLAYETCPKQLPGMEVTFHDGEQRAHGVVKRVWGGQFGIRNTTVISDGRTFVRLTEAISVCEPSWWRS